MHHIYRNSITFIIERFFPLSKNLKVYQENDCVFMAMNKGSFMILN